jgi:hypothetical protein
MGNPVITRLGINQFWYKHWYSDHQYAQVVKEDALITQFTKFYLNHGVIRESNPFVHEYWYRKTYRKIRSQDQKYKNLQAFRRYFYTNERLGIEHSYFIRYRTGEYFPMRLWVMRYGGWLFISVHWFKPLKSKRSKYFRSRSKTVGSISRSTASEKTFKRSGLVAQYVSSLAYKKTTYIF